MYRQFSIFLVLLVINNGISAQLIDKGAIHKIDESAFYYSELSLSSFKNYVYAAYRESTGPDGMNSGADGKIRILRTKNGKKWEKIGFVFKTAWDLHNPQLLELPNGKLAVTALGIDYSRQRILSRKNFLFLSEDGVLFTPPQEIKLETKEVDEFKILGFYQENETPHFLLKAFGTEAVFSAELNENNGLCPINKSPEKLSQTKSIIYFASKQDSERLYIEKANAFQLEEGPLKYPGLSLDPGKLISLSPIKESWHQIEINKNVLSVIDIDSKAVLGNLDEAFFTEIKEVAAYPNGKKMIILLLENGKGGSSLRSLIYTP